MRAIRALVAIAVVLTLGPALADGAGAGGCEGYSSCCGFVLDPPVVPLGGTVHIIGSGFEPGVELTFFIRPADDPEATPMVLGTVTPDPDDPDGNIDVEFPVPPELGDASYEITVECFGNVASNVLVLFGGDVLPTTPTTVPDGTLPGTGSDRTGDLVRVGIAGVVLGAVVLVAVDRRRKRTLVTSPG